MKQSAERRGSLDGQTVLLVAGLADLTVSTLESAWGTVRGMLRRSDAADLATEAERELLARGRLVIDRYATVPPAHLEVLAQRALARQAADDV